MNQSVTDTIEHWSAGCTGECQNCRMATPCGVLSIDQFNIQTKLNFRINTYFIDLFKAWKSECDKAIQDDCLNCKFGTFCNMMTINETLDPLELTPDGAADLFIGGAKTPVVTNTD